MPGAAGAVALGQLAMLEFAGERRAEFMQGYFTRDTAELAPGCALFGAVCNIKGRAVCTGWLLEHDNRLHLRISADLVEPVRAMLAKYAPFTRTTLGVGTWLGVGLLGDTALQFADTPVGSWREFDGAVLLRAHGARPRFELWGPAPVLTAVLKRLPAPALGRQHWLLADVEAGVVTVDGDSSEQHVPQVIGLNALGGIDFDKGCYLGQEVIARLQYRGSAKRGLRRLFLPAANRLPDSAQLEAEGRRCGELVTTALATDGVHALAVLAADAPAPDGPGDATWQFVDLHNEATAAS